MATLELGTFLLLNFFGFICLYLFKRYSVYISLFSVFLFAILGLYLIADYDIIVTNTGNTTLNEFGANTSYVMNVLSNTGADTVYGSGNSIMAELITSGSTAMNKEIDTIELFLRKTGNPTGNATVGVFDGSGNLKKSFGSLNVATLTGSNNILSFSIYPDKYTIASNDRIGIQYLGGDASNHINMLGDSGDPFDGSNAYKQRYTGTWTSSTTTDQSMSLIRHIDATEQTETKTDVIKVIDSAQFAIGYVYFVLALIVFIIFVSQLAIANRNKEIRA